MFAGSEGDFGACAAAPSGQASAGGQGKEGRLGTSRRAMRVEGL